MDPEFWHQRWKENRIAFHEGRPNTLLVAHFEALGLPQRSRVFVPLCGKTRDIGWLLSQGHRVAGAELSEAAIVQLFAELGVEPQITRLGELSRYSAPNLDIFVGDIFQLTRTMLGPVDAIIDRAALVALPADMRPRYADHLSDITDKAPHLLITFEYDQTQMAGPPFSISEDDVRRLYGARYDAVHLVTVEVPGGLKGQCAATESAWLLKSSG